MAAETPHRAAYMLFGMGAYQVNPMGEINKSIENEVMLTLALN
jgi:hypothetical protein